MVPEVLGQPQNYQKWNTIRQSNSCHGDQKGKYWKTEKDMGLRNTQRQSFAKAPLLPFTPIPRCHHVMDPSWTSTSIMQGHHSLHISRNSIIGTPWNPLHSSHVSLNRIKWIVTVNHQTLCGIWITWITWDYTYVNLRLTTVPLCSRCWVKCLHIIIAKGKFLWFW